MAIRPKGTHGLSVSAEQLRDGKQVTHRSALQISHQGAAPCLHGGGEEQINHARKAAGTVLAGHHGHSVTAACLPDSALVCIPPAADPETRIPGHDAAEEHRGAAG